MFSEEIKDNKDAVFEESEDQDNLVDFFNLLLTIDKRINPQLYD